MKSKGHFYTSIVKSLIRIIGAGMSIFYMNNLVIAVALLSGCLLIAEILGILEEVLDKRD